MTQRGKRIIIWSLVALIVALFAMRAITPASILSALLFLVTVIDRLVSIWWAFHTRAGTGYSQEGVYPHPAKEKMTEMEAREILGVDELAEAGEIKQAYHKLIQKNHPDKGGSKYLAAQINQARDVLIAALEKGEN